MPVTGVAKLWVHPAVDLDMAWRQCLYCVRSISVCRMKAVMSSMRLLSNLSHDLSFRSTASLQWDGNPVSGRHLISGQPPMRLHRKEEFLIMNPCSISGWQAYLLTKHSHKTLISLCCFEDKRNSNVIIHFIRH